MSADALVGKIIDGRFEILEKLGVGGMGAVYRARQRPLNRLVALKVLSGEMASSNEAVRRFLREARVISRLQQPHTVKVVDFGELSTGEPYLAMEHIEGRPLDQVLAGGRLPWKRSALIAGQVCLSLSEAHTLKIIHRDIKPANIMFHSVGGQPDFVKVLDFGIAKVESSTTQLTRAGMVVGTPSYLSPEQARGEEVDWRADIYALGVLLFEMVTGDLPFKAEKVHVIIYKHIHEMPKRLNDYPGVGAPPALDRLVYRMMAKSRDERPQSMDEVRRALETIAKGEHLQEPGFAPLTDDDDRTIRQEPMQSGESFDSVRMPSAGSITSPSLSEDKAVWIPANLISHPGNSSANPKFDRTSLNIGELNSRRGRRFLLSLGVVAGLAVGAVFLFRTLGGNPPPADRSATSTSTAPVAAAPESATPESATPVVDAASRPVALAALPDSTVPQPEVVIPSDDAAIVEAASPPDAAAPPSKGSRPSGRRPRRGEHRPPRAGPRPPKPPPKQKGFDELYID